MHWVVFQIASGRAFFAAIALLLCAVLVRPRGSPRLRRVRTWSLLLGLIGLVVSATPLPYWAYGLIGLSVAMPFFAKLSGKSASLLTAAGALALVAVGLNEARYHVVPVLRPSPTRLVAIIGDSLTAGHGTTDASQKWPAILRARHGLEVQDLSHIGETTASAAQRLEQASVDAPIVIVEIGGNDVLGGSSVTDFEAGLDDLLARLRRRDRQIVMFELPIPPLYEGFGRVQRKAASRHGVLLVPKRVLLSVIESAEATVDSLHLTQQGHDRMAGFVWALLEPAMPLVSVRADPDDATDDGGRKSHRSLPPGPIADVHPSD